MADLQLDCVQYSIVRRVMFAFNMTAFDTSLFPKRNRVLQMCSQLNIAAMSVIDFKLLLLKF